MLPIRRSRPLLVAIAIGLMAAASLAGLAAAAPNPPGNNGTVKVDGVPFDDLPNNVEHTWRRRHGDVDAAFASAFRVVRHRMINQRLYPMLDPPPDPLSGGREQRRDRQANGRHHCPEASLSCG